MGNAHSLLRWLISLLRPSSPKTTRTHSAYSTALNYFLESCPKLHVEDVDRKDLLKFSAFLRDEKIRHPAPSATSSKM